MKKIVVGLSGGVDSAVTAYLLKEQGYEVIGVTLCMHENAEQEVTDAAEVAARIGIRHRVVELKKRFKETIVRYFTESYKKGETPNPCMVCNPLMKWTALLSVAEEEGAEGVATGHYAGVVRLLNGRYAIRCGASAAKDQAYVLYGLSQEQLSKTRMPLAVFEKEKIREIAAKIGLSVAEKADSMEICFLQEGEAYADYLIEKEDVNPEKGNFVDEVGNVLGTHQGIIYYTVGQRKGLGIAFGEPRYVKELRPERNEVVLSGNDALQSKIVYAREYRGMALAEVTDEMRLLAKIRYSHRGAMCTVYREGDRLRLEFDEPQRAATPGQAVVFYRTEETEDGESVSVVAGGAVICREQEA
jgi:tRNA-specific 2-thiouridylase